MIPTFRVKKRRVIRDEVFAEPGDVVFYCMMADYGCANDDTRETGKEHISVTKDPEGGYPFFTIAAQDIERIAKATGA